MTKSPQACVDWEGVAGAPLTLVLKAVGNFDGDAALEFFSSRPSNLNGLMPVEVLAKVVQPARIPKAGRAILALPPEDRLAAVVAAAETFCAAARRRRSRLAPSGT